MTTSRILFLSLRLTLCTFVLHVKSMHHFWYLDALNPRYRQLHHDFLVCFAFCCCWAVYGVQRLDKGSSRSVLGIGLIETCVATVNATRVI